MKKFGTGVVVVLALLVGVGFLLPTEQDLTRSIVVNAKPSKIHDWVVDLKKWDEWLPVSENRGSESVTFSKKTKGKGASYSWEDAKGSGQLVLTGEEPDRSVTYDLILDNGRFRGTGAIVYEVFGKSTRITWTLKGKMDVPVIGGYLNLIKGIRARGLFEKGLENLKTKVDG